MSFNIGNPEDQSHQNENDQNTVKDQKISFKNFVSTYNLRRCIEFTLSEGIALFDLQDLASVGIVKTTNFSKILRYQVKNQIKCDQWIEKLQFAILNQTWQPSRPKFFDEPKSIQLSSPRSLCSLNFEDHVVYYLLANYLIRLNKQPFYTNGLNDRLNASSLFRKNKFSLIKKYDLRPHSLNEKENKQNFIVQRQFLQPYFPFWLIFKKSSTHIIEFLQSENAKLDDQTTEAQTTEAQTTEGQTDEYPKIKPKFIRSQPTKKSDPFDRFLIRENRLLKTNLKKEFDTQVTIHNQINQEINHFDLLMCQTDIMQFFDHIRHDVLLAKIKSYFPKIEDYPYQLLEECLNKWSGNSFFSNQNIGIPQNVYPSKILANLYLKSFDEAITQLNPANERERSTYSMSKIYYDRYVDDMKFYVYDRIKYPHPEDFQKVIQNTIQTELQKLGLSINGSKTKFFDQQIEHQNPITDWRMKSIDHESQNQSKMIELYDLERVFNFDFFLNLNQYSSCNHEPYVSENLLKAILNLTELLGFDEFFKSPELLPAYLVTYMDEISKTSNDFKNCLKISDDPQKLEMKNEFKKLILNNSKKLNRSKVSLKDIDWFYRTCLNQLRVHLDLKKTTAMIQNRRVKFDQDLYELRYKQIQIIKKCSMSLLDKHAQYLEYYLQLPLKLQDYLDLLVFYENYHYYPYLRFLFYEKLTWLHHQKNLKTFAFFSLQILITEIKKIESKYPSDCSAYAFKLCDILNQIELAKTEKFDFDWSSIV